MKNNVPYFNNANEWVESLPYGQPLQGNNGYVYDNPFKSRWGESPLDVYNRLFTRDHYYNLTDEEMTKLRTTIQYLPIYLDTALDNNIKFLESCGFKVYKKEGKPGDLMHVYLKRNNISLYISNQTTPQDYRPNKINVSVGELIKKPNWKNPRRVECNSTYTYDYGFDMPDDFGELTKQELEKHIKKYMTEIIPNDMPVYKERGKLTFGDLHKFAVGEKPIKKLTVPVYVVNSKSGNFATIPNPGYFDNTGLSKAYCAVSCGGGKCFYIQHSQIKSTTAKQIMFPTVSLHSEGKEPLYTDFVLCLSKQEAKKLAIDTLKEKIKKEQEKINKIKHL
jgi:hypothetical protein